jgi:hypothetical protein
VFDHLNIPDELPEQRRARLDYRARMQNPTLSDVAALASSAVLREQADKVGTRFQGYTDFSTSTGPDQTGLRRRTVASSLGINI